MPHTKLSTVVSISQTVKSAVQYDYNLIICHIRCQGSDLLMEALNDGIVTSCSRNPSVDYVGKALI